ncbi:MAG TPA: toxin-antitoxin system HicB family antitoxin [Streptosporangiaceae bacterium]|nr:toxin-antitoxin system HicB family antitoxin [Streptosporangiaceae bacterium]
MELSEYVAGLRTELESVGQIGGEEAARAVRLIAHGLEPAVRLTLLDVLSAAAAEITSRLDGTAVEVRLSGGEPSFAIQHAAPPVPAEPSSSPGADEADDTGTARVTLRLSESLKSRIEGAAAEDGVSVNNWLVRAARRALDGPDTSATSTFRRGPGQRFTGFARS